MNEKQNFNNEEQKDNQNREQKARPDKQDSRGKVQNAQHHDNKDVKPADENKGRKE